MRMSRFGAVSLLAAAALVSSMFTGVGSASADTTTEAVRAEALAKASHKAAVDYWTVDKVRDAKPRNIVVDKDGKVSVDTSVKPLGQIAAPTPAPQDDRWTRGGKVLKTTGKILFEMKKNATEWAHFVCSASTINDGVSGKTIVLTAGHCTFDTATKSAARKWIFVPDFDSARLDTLDKEAKFCEKTPYGCWSTLSWVTTEEYMAKTGLDAQAFDYAFVVFGKGGKSWQDLDEAVGGQNISFNPQNGDGYAFGYPKGEPYNGLELHYANSRIGGGGNGIFNMVNKMTGGCSGGPWMREFSPSSGEGVLTSVNSFAFKSDEGKPDRKMYGPVLNERAQQYYQQAQRMAPKAGFPIPGAGDGPKPTPTQKPTPSADPTDDPGQGGEVAVTNDNYRDIIAKSSQTPTIFIVGANWSGQTNNALPKFRSKLSADGNSWTLAYVDGSLYKQARDAFNIKGYPTIIGYSNGSEMSSPARYADGSRSQDRVNSFVNDVVRTWKNQH